MGPNSCYQTTKKLNKHDLHTYISKPNKTSRSEGVDLLLSTEMMFSDNSVASSYKKKITPVLNLNCPRNMPRAA